MVSLDKEADVIHHSPAPSSEGLSQLDDTYEAYKNNQGANVDPSEAKKTLQKIDFRIVPILFFTYLLQYLDKNGINYASAFGLQKGTNLEGQDYSWLGTCKRRTQKYFYSPLAGSIFYFGYLAGQYPAGYLLQRLPMGKFLGFCTLGQSCVSNLVVPANLVRLGSHSHDHARMSQLCWHGC